MLKNNKKGFSLVELIIVIAIMVALVAVMAPAFVKYVKSSRDATLKNAGESVMEFAKSEYATGKITLGNTPGSIKIYADQAATPKGTIKIECSGFNYDGTDVTTSNSNGFDTGCGVSGTSASELIINISLAKGTDGNVVITSALQNS